MKFNLSNLKHRMRSLLGRLWSSLKRIGSRIHDLVVSPPLDYVVAGVAGSLFGRVMLGTIIAIAAWWSAIWSVAIVLTIATVCDLWVHRHAVSELLNWMDLQATAAEVSDNLVTAMNPQMVT